MRRYAVAAGLIAGLLSVLADPALAQHGSHVHPPYEAAHRADSARLDSIAAALTARLDSLVAALGAGPAPPPPSDPTPAATDTVVIVDVLDSVVDVEARWGAPAAWDILVVRAPTTQVVHDAASPATVTLPRTSVDYQATVTVEHWSGDPRGGGARCATPCVDTLGVVPVPAAQGTSPAPDTTSPQPAPAPSNRPNEPAGFTQYVSHDYNTAYRQADDIRCDAPGAPASPDCYARVTLPQGTVGGHGTGSRHAWDVPESTELYVALWVRLRGGPDADTWEQHSVGTKAYYVAYSDVASATMWSNHTGQQGTFNALPFHVTLVFYNAQGNRQTRKVRDDRTPRFTVNDWHLIESYYRLNDFGSANGVYRLWLDGTLLISVSDVRYVQPGHSTRGFHNVKPDNIWGGGPEVKQRTDYVDLEHLYVSGRP